MLCFLNCHLPAHMDKAEQRKDNFQTILSLQQFQGPGAQGILDHEYGPPGRGRVGLGRGWWRCGAGTPPIGKEELGAIWVGLEGKGGADGGGPPPV